MTHMQALPARSVLIDLAPIGVGTRQAESMDSYLWRLACAHDVSTSAMKTFILDGESMTHTRFLARRADCPSVTGLRIADRLPALTLQPDTGRIGIGRHHGRLSVHYTIRRHRCWCPQCIVEMKGNAPYLPLAWSLEGYSYCTRHGRKTVSACPGCDRRFDAKAEWLPVDEFCPDCGASVCGDGEDSERKPATAAEIALSDTLEQFCLECSDIPNSVEEAHPRGVKLAIAEALKTGVVGSEQELASMIGLTPLFLDKFLSNSAALPNLCVLSRLSLVSGISMAGILHEPLWQKRPVQIAASELEALPLAHGGEIRSYEPMIQAAREAIASGQGIRMPQLARSLNISEATLRTAIGPKLAAELRLSAAKHRREMLQKTFDGLVSNMKETYLRLRREGVPLSAARLAREMGRFGEHGWFMRAYRIVESSS